jgi:lipopolysaccharide/colanic/teichoic acid biosynthesis glycosyltransferase
MQTKGVYQTKSASSRRAAHGNGRGAVPLIREGLAHQCHRHSWWRVDHLLNGFAARAPAMRQRTPILTGLLDPVRADQASSWFVGHVPWGKRILDLALIVLALPVLVPLFLAVGAYIRLVSNGPIFYTQERVGFREGRFRMFKFRSMKVNADTKSHESHTTFLFKSDKPMEKMDHVDPRLIPFAWVIRSTGIDELPQLINVVRGEMSLVGPRPCTVYEHEVLLPWHKRRCEVLPGLTGLWQVNGKNKTTFQQMINFDIAYARQWSLGLDLRIVFSTLPVLVGQLREMIEKRRRAAVSPVAQAEAVGG